MKKKLYLYLGLLGVGLILGSFGALINKNIDNTYALDTNCTDGMVNYSQCLNCETGGGTWYFSTGKCNTPPTQCGDYISSSTNALCSNCLESSGTWSFSSTTCTCPTGYTKDSDGICQLNGGGSTTINSCSDYSSSSGWRDPCSNCEESGGSWSYNSQS